MAFCMRARVPEKPPVYVFILNDITFYYYYYRRRGDNKLISHLNDPSDGRHETGERRRRVNLRAVRSTGETLVTLVFGRASTTRGVQGGGRAVCILRRFTCTRVGRSPSEIQGRPNSSCGPNSLPDIRFVHHSPVRYASRRENGRFSSVRPLRILLTL